MVQLLTTIRYIDITLDMASVEIKDIRIDYRNNERHKVRAKKREVFYVEQIPEGRFEAETAPLRGGRSAGLAGYCLR